MTISSALPADSVQPPSSEREAPWNREDVYPVKPEGHAYGFKQGRKLQPCDLDELLTNVATPGLIPTQLVWTPEFSRLVPPAEVSYLQEPLLRQARSRAKQMIWAGILCAVMMAPSLFLGGASLIVVFAIVTAVGIIPMVQGFHLLRQLRNPSEEFWARERKNARFQTWISTRRIFYTWILAGCLLVVGGIQLSVGLPYSVETAGLVKPKVLDGELWRLCTYGFLHANILHFYFNFFFLLSFGRILETLADKVLLPLVFLPASILAGIASLIVNPAGTTVGASGGLMGIVGFLLILGLRRKTTLSARFVKLIWTNVIFILTFGFILFRLIDNAAHLGGLLYGVLMGIWLVNRKENKIPLKLSTAVHVLGLFVAILTLLTVIVTIVVLIAEKTR